MATLDAFQTQDRSLSPLRLAGMYVGTVVGAGFASGQEVLQFFGYFGISGLWGILLATIIFVAFGGMALILGRRLGAVSHVEVVRAAGLPWVGTLIDAVVTLFLLAAFSAMAAGAGAVFVEQFGLPALWGNVAMAAISVATVLLGIEGVIAAISFVAPFLLTAVFSVCVFSLMAGPIDWGWARHDSAALPTWWMSAIAYGAYNLVFAIAILAPAGTLASERRLRAGALLGGVGLGLGALAIHLALLSAVPNVTGFEIPMLYLVTRALGPLAVVYSVVLFAEVYTTAVASLYGFVARITDPQGPRFRGLVFAAGAAGFVGSLVGFSELVGKVYSAVGIAGLALLVTLAVAYLKSESQT